MYEIFVLGICHEAVCTLSRTCIFVQAIVYMSQSAVSHAGICCCCDFVFENPHAACVIHFVFLITSADSVQMTGAYYAVNSADGNTQMLLHCVHAT